MKLKRKRAAAQGSAPLADHGTAERARHDELVGRGTEAPGVVAKRVRYACRLDWYSAKASIIDRQHAAGLRFRSDWLIAAAPPKLVGTYAPLRLPARQSFTEIQLFARRRVARALDALPGPVSKIVLDVCGFDQWASGDLPLLREGLTLLADHYCLPKDDR
jgi:hypothetical protein